MVNRIFFFTFFFLQLGKLDAQSELVSSEKILKVTVYYIPKESYVPISVNETSIKSSNGTLKFDIIDSSCLMQIEKQIGNLRKFKATHNMRSIYLYCEVFYENGFRDTISFESANQGVIKIRQKMYQHSTLLESVLIACNPKIPAGAQ